MHEKHQAWAAYTSFPNTDDSDRRRYVSHDVSVRTANGNITVRLMAEAPDTAIDMVNRMTADRLATLERVEPAPEK